MNSNICNAIRRDDLDSLKTLVDQLPDIHASCFSIHIEYEEKFPTTSLSLLHIAAYFNSINCFRYLYEEKHLILRHLGGHNYIPLHYALYKSSVDVSMYILKEDPEESTFHLHGVNNKSILYCAVISNKIELVQEVMKNGAKVTDPWLDEFELLESVLPIHNNDIFQLLYEQRGPNMKTIQNTNRLAISAIRNYYSFAIDIIYNEEECRRLINNDLNLFIKLIYEIISNDFRFKRFKDFLLRALSYAKDLELEPPPNLIEYDRGLCHFVCLYFDIDVAKALIKTPGFMVNRLDSNNKPGPICLLHQRNKKEVAEMLELLIENGLDVNLRHNANSPTILECFVTSMTKNYEVIELLIKLGADVNANHSRGNISLRQFVLEKQSNDDRLKKIFEQAE